MDRITEYTLDVSKWICGDSGLGPGGGFVKTSTPHLGVGITLMLNDEGYMCCLGQFALQAGVNEDTIRHVIDPGGVARSTNKIYDSNVVEMESGHFCNTQLARSLMNINDNSKTSPPEIIELIRQKLNEHGIALKVLDPNNQLEAFK